MATVEAGLLIAAATSLGKLLARHAWSGDVAADLGDAKELVVALRELRQQRGAPRRTVALDAAIAAELSRCLGRNPRAGRTLKEDLQVAAQQASWVIDEASEDPETLLQAAIEPLSFARYLTGLPIARQVRRDLATDQEGVFDAVLHAAAAVMCELAPGSPAFAQAALLRVAASVPELRDLVLGTQALIEANLEATRAHRAETDYQFAQLRHDLTSGRARPADPRTWEPIQQMRAVGRGRNHLGVHPAISINGTSAPDLPALTQYVVRPHDARLRAVLAEAAKNGQSLMTVLIGKSSTGKTRAMREAVAHVLPDAPVYVPRDQWELAATVEAGLPATGCVVWLDELQTHLDHGELGARVARALTTALETLPITVMASIWPDNLTALVCRPAADEAVSGGGSRARAIEQLLAGAGVVQIPIADDILGASPDELELAAHLDPRVQLARETSSRDGNLIQVLAGGTRLLTRLRDQHDPDAFSPAASAVIHAAADLVRVGHPTYLPAALLKEAARGYLTDRRRTHPGWVDAGLAEATTASTTANSPLDFAAKGVPALTLRWGNGSEGESYELHDYLVQDHLRTHRSTPTAASLWDALIGHARNFDPVIAQRIKNNAQLRGLYEMTFRLFDAALEPNTGQYLDWRRKQVNFLKGDLTALTDAADSGDWGDHDRLDSLLAARGDIETLTHRADAGEGVAKGWLGATLIARGEIAALTARADNHDQIAQELLADYFLSRGDTTALSARADTGDEHAQWQLAELLAARGELVALTERARAGDPYAQVRLAVLLAANAESTSRSVQWRERDVHAARRQIQDQLFEQLATNVDLNDQKVEFRIAALLAGGAADHRDPPGDTIDRLLQDGISLMRKRFDLRVEILALRQPARKFGAVDRDLRERFVNLLRARGDIRSLTACADTDADDTHAQSCLAGLLIDRGEMATLTARADTGNPSAQSSLANLLVNLGDIRTLTARADAGDKAAQSHLAALLLHRGETAALIDRAESDDGPSMSRLVELLIARDDPTALIRWVHAAVPQAAAGRIGLLIRANRLAGSYQLDVESNLVSLHIEG